METKLTNPKDIECAIRNILSYIGENPNREGLVGTPDRILRMWQEIFRGYDLNKSQRLLYSRMARMVYLVVVLCLIPVHIILCASIT